MALTDLTRISTSGIATGSSLSGAILHGDAHFRGTQVGVTSALFDSSDDALEFNDNVKLTFGNDGDLKLYHNGSHSYIDETGMGNLYIRNGTKNSIWCKTDGQVNLYFNDVKKFETTNHGAVVTGILTATGFSGPLSNASGISTFYDLRVTNNLTVEGTTTTLDTNLIGVDRVEVGATSDTIVGVAITQTGSADILNLFNANGEQVTVLSSGNVGIGSAIPELDLDVTRVASGDNVVKFENRASALSLIKYPNVNNADVRAGSDYGNFAVYTGGDSGSRKLKVEHGGDVIVENGKLGIGSDNPTQALDVVGNIKASGTITGSSFVGALPISNDGNNRVITATGTTGTLNAESNFTYNGAQVDITGTTDGVLNLDTTDGRGSFIRFKEGGTTKVWVGCSEGIGTGGDQDDLGLRATGNIIMRAGGTTGLTVYDTNVRIPTKLGINGAVPSTPLDVIANASGYAMAIRGRSSDNIAELRFTSNDYASALYSSIQTGATYLNFQVGSVTNALRIDSSGQVSIGGNSTVNTKLHVENSSGDAHIRLRGSVNYGVLFTRHSDGALTGFVGSGGAVNLGGSNLGISASLSGGDIVFQTGGTASINERARILSNGNIGINTTTAPHKLSVKGTISMISGAGGTQIVNLSSSSNNGYVMVNDSSGTTRARLDSSGVSYVRGGNFGVGTNSPNSIIEATGSNSSTGYYFKNTNTTSGFGMRVEGGGTTADRYSLAVFEAQGTERFRVNANGRVGINSAAPEFEVDIISPTGVTNTTVCLKGRGSGWSQLRLEGEGGAAENYITSTTVPLAFYVGSGSQKAKLDTNGMFLIGSGGADRHLHIKQSATTTYAKIENTGSSSNYTGINLLTPSLNFQIWNQGPGATGYAGANSVNFWQASATGPYAFFHGNDERFRIDTNGRIGVNNTDPDGRTGSIDISSNDGTSGKTFTDQRAASMLTLRNPSTTQHSFTQMAFINGGGTQAATLLRHRYGSSHGSLANYVGDLCLFRRTGGAGSGANDFRESTRWCGDNAEARQIWWAYGDSDTSNTGRLGWHHLSAQRDHPGTDAYSFFRLEIGAASYARNGMGKYTVVWTTGHASGYGLQIGHFGYYMPHGSSTIVVNEHIIHRERWSNGSYYGWNDAPNMRIINNTASGGTNAAISFRCGGRRYSGGYDMDVRVGIFIELYAPESANGDRTPRLYVAGNSDSNLSGGGFGNPVTHAYVSFQSTNPLSSGQPTNTINTGLPTSNPANAGEFYRDGTDLRVSTG